MRIFKQLAIVFATILAFGGCQKELNFEGDVSIGSLKSALTGDCNPITVVGIYRVDSTLTNDNYVDVQIDVSFGGTFEVKSDTVNGFSFYKTGSVGKGLNTVRLYPSGKPVAAVPTTFTIMYDSTICTFSINVIPNTAGGAVFSLGGAPGNCSGFNVFGAYNAGTALDAGDSVTILVDVPSQTLPATYSITTGPTAVNGMIFSATGSFTNPGIQSVTLHGSGTPVSGSVTPYSFTPSGGGTTCSFAITVLPAGGGTAVYTLNGGPFPGTCSGAVLHGTYIAGTALTSGNTVDIFVNVTTPGTYFITTGPTPVNGMVFSKTGTFSGINPSQIVTLIGSGTPTNAIGSNFTVTGGTSTCVFSVTAITSNLDYIPETIGTNWTDHWLQGTATDTTFNQVSANTIVTGTPSQTYRKFYVTDNTMAVIDSIYHRKGAGKYYEYFYGTLGLDNPINKEVMMLDSTLAVNGTWSVDLGPNSVGGGTINFSDVQISAKITSKGTTEMIAGNTYNNVIKVKFTYLVDFGAGLVAQAEEVFWYAKGFGLIYDEQNDVPVTTTNEYETTRIQVF